MGRKCCESFEFSEELLSKTLQEHKQWHDTSAAVCRVWLGWLKPKEQLGRISCGRKNKQTRMNIQTHPHPQETVANIINLYKTAWGMWATGSNSFCFCVLVWFFLRRHTHYCMYYFSIHADLAAPSWFSDAQVMQKTKANSGQVWNS